MRDPKAIKRARRFRKEPTKTENRLWQRVRGEKLGGAKFRRQADIGSFVVDFVCMAARLVVEVDGGIHNHPDVAPRDAERDEILKSKGFQILRFSAAAVESDLESVLIVIERTLKDSSFSMRQGGHYDHL